MTKKRTRRINITPDDLEVGGLLWLGNKFTLTFTEYRSKENIEVIIRLDFWWIEHIAENLHKVINYVAGKVDDARFTMRGDS